MTHWRTHGRHDLPWRQTTDPYAILVSEVMLQQTQVERAIPYFRGFLARFPTFAVLARARTATVLTAWQGLGYNRRALMLQRCARAVCAEHTGCLPRDYDALRALPGVGPYTAGAVLAFAFNEPHPIIETNIRRVYLHHFFPRRFDVPDSRILPLVVSHLSLVISPRDWFGALMDYGTHLASTLANPNRRSRHYSRQSTFEGSDRQLRGRILKALITKKQERPKVLFRELGVRQERGVRIIDALEREGFLVHRDDMLRCA